MVSDTEVGVREIPAQPGTPKRAVVTAGMPYANGPLHLGHLAGAHVPADIHARWLGMLMGRENVLFVCGSDDHGTTAELAALRQGRPISDVVGDFNARQEATLRRYAIDLDVYSGTSQAECFEQHTSFCNTLLGKLQSNGLLTKRSSLQWYDPSLGRFLPDRFVVGRCPNPNCDNTGAYSDECEVCGLQYEPSALIEPKSAISAATPEMRETTHLWLNMAGVSEVLRTWIQSRQKIWRPATLGAVLDRVMPALRLPKSERSGTSRYSPRCRSTSSVTLAAVTSS
jgi:methionyl-tRNA synthetase